MLITTHTFMKQQTQFLLGNAYRYRGLWTLQGFGMLRLYLTEDTRLHIWNPELATHGVSDIHDHPWDFTSYVVGGGGEIHQRKLYPCRHPRELNCCCRSFYRTQIQCGEGGGPVGEVDRVAMGWGVDERYHEGQTYSQSSHELHRTDAEPGTVTLVHRTFKADRDHAHVYWERGVWVSAEPRRATEEEVSECIQLAIERWWG